MGISKKGFFTNDEVLFIGVSRDSKSFSRSVYNDFVKAGIKVFPVNKEGFVIKSTKVEDSVDKFVRVPECAYILLNKDNTKDAVKGLKEKGVKKVLFHSKSTVDEETLEACKKDGLEAHVACAKMFVGKAPIHKIHGFIAGVR